jgi:hypothetical protein
MWEEYVRIIGGKMKFANTNRTDNGEGKPLCTCIYAARYREKKNKAWNTITDVEGRRLREWRGLDTPVAWADNDECHRLALCRTINESGSTPPQE